MTQFSRLFGFISAAILLLASLGCGRMDSGTSVDGEVTFPQPKEKVDETVKQSFPAGAKPTIVVDTFAGNVDFEIGEGNNVAVDVLKQGWGETKEEAGTHLKEIDLTIKQEGDTIRVIATRSTTEGTKTVTLANGATMTLTQNMTQGKTDIRIKGPAQAVLELKTRFGNIASTGAANTLKADSASGAITVKQNSAAFDLTSQFGAISIEGPGAGTAKSSSGQITAKGCSKPIVLESGFGALSIDNAAGVTATTKSGAITVKASKGPFRCKSGFGRIAVSDANGLTEAHTSSGDIQLTGGQGEFVANTGFGAVKIDVKDSPVRVETSSGNIDIRGSRGTVKAQSGFGAVEVRGSEAVIQLRSNSGNVLFDGSLAAGDSQISSGFGTAEAKLPADSQFKLDASTDFGKVSSQFEMTKTKESEKQLIGSVGADPKIALRIESKSGNVRIDKK